MEAQLVETAILNIINHQSLIATKAARVCYAARGDGIMEFGLRRAQGPDAGIYGALIIFQIFLELDRLSVRHKNIIHNVNPPLSQWQLIVYCLYLNNKVLHILCQFNVPFVGK